MFRRLPLMIVIVFAALFATGFKAPAKPVKKAAKRIVNIVNFIRLL